MKERIGSIIILLVAIVTGFFVYSSEINPESGFHFKYGLDLSGGSHLVYKADISSLDSSEVGDAMESLKTVIERRVNLFGVAEPLVQVEKGGVLGTSNEERLIVELPGVTDLDEAIKLIGKTPLLEFKLLTETATNTEEFSDTLFTNTGLTGRLLERANLSFDQVSREPYVTLTFNSEGKELFAEITRNNVGEVLAIFLDGEILSMPVIQEEIDGGEAQISGGFNPEEARILTRDLNLGALPVPIELISTENVGAFLGQNALNQGVYAGFIGILLIILFMILWYRLPGLIASISLVIYILIILAIFKLVPVTLTAAGIAGFILSVGMAVDANILIFERMKEELKKGEPFREAALNGFSRAWLSIRDGNLSSIITAVILFWFGTSSVEGFALVFGLGVFFSMLTAILLTRTLILSILPKERNKFTEFLFKAK